jgi:BirA family transcriptional regulator, biotin operon repressor / biotin---[acetyl-CoA-carboxylase] ligase
MNWRIHRFVTLPSTNDLALEWMREGRANPGDVFVAARQTGGRGRPGRAWHSPEGALLFTAVLPFRPERAGWTALAAGLAVARAVRELGAPAGVKWPNDVVLDGRKLAGVLAETTVPHLVAVGIGLNVTNPPPADSVLAGRVIRLADAVPDARPDSTLEVLLRHLSECWALLFARDLAPLHQAWVELDRTAGRRIRWSEEGVTGLAAGVDTSGALLIRTSDDRHIRASVGEVAFID